MQIHQCTRWSRHLLESRYCITVSTNSLPIREAPHVNGTIRSDIWISFREADCPNKWPTPEEQPQRAGIASELAVRAAMCRKETFLSKAWRRRKLTFK